MSKTIRVIKTDRLNRKKLKRVARRYGVAPIAVRELQLGYVEELPESVALKMIEAGLVQRAKKKKDGDPREMQDKVNVITPTEETVTTDDPDSDVLTSAVDGATNSEMADDEDDGEDGYIG